MKCPVCDNVNESMVCVRCGFDSSRDYEKYPTFGPVGKGPAVSALRREWGQGDPPPPKKKKPWLAIAVCAAIFALGIGIGAGLGGGKAEPTEPGESVQLQEPVVMTTAPPETTEQKVPPESTEPGESAQMQEPQEDEVRAQASTILADMTLEEKIWQMFVVDIDQLAGRYSVTKSGTKVKDAIKSKPVGGVICFSDNLIDRVQTDAMIRKIQGYAEIPLFISVDEEGGVVTRLGGRSDFGVTDFGKMYDVGEAGDITKAYEVGATLGEQLRELGFNLDFAPVADIWTNPDNLVIGKRAFGSEPNEVANMVSSCVRGFMNQNVLCTLKHFPGYGDTVGDSHDGSVSCKKTLEELWDCELVPFRSGIEAGAPVVMIGHINLPNVAGAEDVPASLSGTIISDLLRDQMGFEGLIITDAMSMGAITAHYRSDEAARLAIQAGVDLILMPDDMDAAFKGILDAVASGEISGERIDESVLRILETKLRYGIIPESNG